ncbi:hypothetical protein [Agathobacter sp.]
MFAVELLFEFIALVIRIGIAAIKAFVGLLVTVPQYIGTALGYAIYCMIVYTVYKIDIPWYLWIIGVIPALLIAKGSTLFEYTHRGITFFSASSIAYTLYYLSEMIPWPTDIIRLIILIVAEIGFCIYIYFMTDGGTDDYNNPITLIASSVLYMLGNVFVVSGFFEVFSTMDDISESRCIVVVSIVLTVIETVISFITSHRAVIGAEAVSEA